MKKKYQLQDLECANCAAKMEAEIAKLSGVHSARVNFLMQKLTLEADEAQLSAIESAVQTIVQKIEPQCRLVLS